MARGWESKSVESQIESAQQVRKSGTAPALTPDQVSRAREREGLQLSRTRVLHDLEHASNPRYRQTLEAALAHLDRRLSELQ
jgi:hypothetical protein